MFEPHVAPFLRCGGTASWEESWSTVGERPTTKAGAICGKLDTAGAVLENEAVCGNVAVTGAVEMLLLADWKEEKLLAGWKLAKEGAVLGWLLAG